MSGEIDITPGYTFADEELTPAKLNALGRPTAKVRPGSITATEIDSASVAGALENVAATRNHLRDPLFTGPWQTSGGQAHGASATRFNHPDWYAYPATGTATVARETITPTGSSGNRFALKVTGDATNTGVTYIGQLVPAAVAGALDQDLALSFYLKNGTGDALTPSVRVLGCSTIDDFSTLAELYSTTTTEIANGQWLRISVLIDVSALTNWRNGGAIEIVIPADALDAGGKSVSLAMPQLERGEVVTEFIVPETARAPRLYVSTSDPTADQDWTEGYRPGDTWINTTDNEAFICRTHQPAAGAVWTSVLAAMPTAPAYIHLQDRKAQNTDPQSVASGSWVTRELTTELVDTGSHCTLSANQFELAAGTYLIEATVPTYQSGSAQARLYNVTDAAVQTDGTNEIYSVSAYATTAVMDRLIVRGRFTLADTKTLRLEHRVSSTSNGGRKANLGPEIYTEVWLTKLA